LRLYLGYPLSYSPKGSFKLKDNFLSEVNCDYSQVPVEVKRKLLSLLENLTEKDYLFLNGVSYDGADILEFSLFPLEGFGLREVVLPGYLYGKSTYLVRELLKRIFKRKVSVLYDFNFFGENTIVLNVGYTKSSVSLGGRLLSVIPVGEFHLVDTLGNYLFNRTIGELGISNARLRKEGMRGVLLDNSRASAARILFRRTSILSVPQLEYEREISDSEVERVLSPVIGSARYGDEVRSPFDFSTAFVKSLYTYEEVFGERMRVSEIFVVGRLSWPFVRYLKSLFPVPIYEFSGEEFLELPVKISSSKPEFRVFYLEKSVQRWRGLDLEPEEVSLNLLRHYFNKKDMRGVKIIEELVKLGSSDDSFVYELLNIVRRCSTLNRTELAYLNASISALSRLDLKDNLFSKVLKELEDKAFNWQLPFETKMNILYFCHRHKEKLKETSLAIFPYLMLTYIRERKISEGERNFVRTVAESFFKG